MEITVNKTPVQTQCKTLGELAAYYKLQTKGVAMAVDNKMVPRIEWDTYPLTDGQRITILKAFSGG